MRQCTADPPQKCGHPSSMVNIPYTWHLTRSCLLYYSHLFFNRIILHKRNNTTVFLKLTDFSHVHRKQVCESCLILTDQRSFHSLGNSSSLTKFSIFLSRVMRSMTACPGSFPSKRILFTSFVIGRFTPYFCDSVSAALAE